MTLTAVNDVASRTLSTSRVFNVSPEALWAAWADPARLRQWWGPKGFTNSFEIFEFREGGDWRFVMHGPDGRDYPNHSSFVEIRPFSRIVIDHVAQPKFRLTATFEDLGGKTRLHFNQEFDTFETFAAVRHYAEPSNEQNLARLEEHLPRWTELSREATFTRVLDAPLDRVWRAWTDADEIEKWWGPSGFDNPVCDFDARVGGKIHIVMRGPDGAQYPVRGEVLVVEPNAKLVFTNHAVDEAGNVEIDGLTTVLFSHKNGKTRVTVATRASATSAQRRHNIAGMEMGWSQQLDRFVAATMAA